MSARDLFGAALVGAGVSAAGGLLSFFPPDFVATRYWPWVVAAGGVVVSVALIVAVRRHPLIRIGMTGGVLVGLAVWLSSSAVPARTPGRDTEPSRVLCRSYAGCSCGLRAA